MSRKGLGMTTVVDEQGKLLGLISDGDLRRLLERHGAAAVELRAADCMTARPVTIPATMLAPAALRLMETRQDHQPARARCRRRARRRGASARSLDHRHDLIASGICP